MPKGLCGLLTYSFAYRCQADSATFIWGEGYMIRFTANKVA